MDKTPNVNDSHYALLKVYAYYRTSLSSMFLIMFTLGLAPNILGTEHPTLFFNTVVIHTTINVCTLILLWRNSFAPKQEKTFLLLFIDVIAIVVMMHASGGGESGLGFLLLASVAIAVSGKRTYPIQRDRIEDQKIHHS